MNLFSLISIRKMTLTSNKLSLFFLLCWSLMAIFAPFLANEKALIIIDKEGWHYPAFSKSSLKQYKEIYFELKAPIPYLPTSLDIENANNVGPFHPQKVKSNYYRHWLGTDALGRDVLSVLIHGSRTAFIIGVFSMLIAGIIGLILGIVAALLGDHKIKVNQTSFFSSILIITAFALSVIKLVPWDIKNVSSQEKITVLIITILFFLSLYFIANRYSKYISSRAIKLPIDLIIGRVIEIMEATPLFFLVVALASVFKPSVFSIILILGTTGWVSIAKYARAETLKVKEKLYIESSRALGFSDIRLTFKHILPNILTPVLTSLAFGIAAAILIESSLSFIGFGISPSDASWGQLLASARSNYQAWWLAVFPGFAIFLTVYSCNTVGEKYQN